MDGLKVSDANLVVYIHPSKANRVPQALRGELSSLLFKFNEAFDGVVLVYDILAQSESAKVLPGLSPYFGVKVKAKLLLFSPKPDMLLEGKVMKLRKESIHVIVLGFSYATIAEEDIRGEFRYKIKHGEEVFASSLHKRHVIKVGSMIRFLIKSFDEEILHISGSLIPANTGSVGWLDKHMNESSEMDRSNKKKRERESGREMEAHGSRVINEDYPPKKSKRQKLVEEF
ncbi:DNA-directed RNA polymerase I subunit rpa43 isoform X1 [Macadamia integrifolia]|uniref:DNA-directed RNA polymerase I subunit rpa43 isoform X1 n=1 Tax=Macadamia integrifolia TaxID=60698 RepID=UPI001C52DB65|nr:DNA-directed RNA polymerase I subunit rpa43 isoform X1 [Macadamia integrifolia]XP_042477064.1 DNA-directed RNA polymerase I subunit rpa43 isoform X1 [Macadamia integrifolia]XP_042477065.1 DNA-directed RNA polymerase I subunit rpa43 isoform X1 [Macadamia integrifolia]XP_042477066.1 DNA-directed RNA polymerase I subunit rpa43 isoform X1 [Macadamia integrifolia]XP_042477067.1 DNA-directed RNA polymerase I subunit rpa43 isoform X1 [Macadamia integrifolia]XP_042477068.1 DNA-directed RNA polymera